MDRTQKTFARIDARNTQGTELRTLLESIALKQQGRVVDLYNKTIDQS